MSLAPDHSMSNGSSRIYGAYSPGASPSHPTTQLTEQRVQRPQLGRRQAGEAARNVCGVTREQVLDQRAAAGRQGHLHAAPVPPLPRDQATGGQLVDQVSQVARAGQHPPPQLALRHGTLVQHRFQHPQLRQRQAGGPDERFDRGKHGARGPVQLDVGPDRILDRRIVDPVHYLFISTGSFACSSTCRVTPPRISCRNRECE